MFFVKYSIWIIYIVLSGLVFHLSHQVALRGENVRDAEINEFPSVVSIGVKDNTHVGTGTLITSRHVLTAAHCLAIMYPAITEIIVGSIDREHGKIHHASHWITYAEWKNRSNNDYHPLEHDIAIITLKLNVLDIEPTKLSKLPSAELYGSELKIAGWGGTNNEEKPTTLKTALLKVISNDECAHYLGFLNDKVYTIDENKLCSKVEPWVVTGSGDSGGPSFNKDNELVGVTVGRVPSDDLFVDHVQPEQYQIVMLTNVNYYREFIDSTVQNELH